MVLDTDARRVFSAGRPEISHLATVPIGNEGIHGLVSRDERSGSVFVSSATDAQGKSLDPEKLPLGLLIVMGNGHPTYLTAGAESSGRDILHQ